MYIDRVAFRVLLERSAASRRELCGVLLGRREPLLVEQVIDGRNLDPAPRNRYLLDAATLLEADARARASGLVIAGFYHSHPAGPAIPSPADRDTMWPGYVYLITAMSGTTAYAGAWVLSRGTICSVAIGNEQ